MTHRSICKPCRSTPSRRWPAYKRVPPFVPVPVRTRRDGWTAQRQGLFIGWLAETGSVREAARRVGCSRETAYRLRRKPGAASFAAVWDAVLALRLGAGDAGGKGIPRRKVTPDELPEWAYVGPIRVRMFRGRLAVVARQPSNTALLRLLSSYDRASRGIAQAGWP